MQPMLTSQAPAIAPQPPTRSLARQLRGCVVLAAVLLLLVLSLTTLGGFFGRLDWRLELLCHFRAQYFWGLALATMLFVACRQWPLAAIAAFGAAVNLALIVPLYWGGQRMPADQRLVRAMSLNVHYRNRDYDAVLELIGREKPEFVLLLEVTPQWVKALGALDSEYPFSRALPRYDASGIALWSRLPIEQFEIRGRAEIGLPTFVAELALPSGLMTLIGTHPASPGSAEHAAMRNRQLTAVARWAIESPYPVMVLGDLNCTGWSPYLADLLADGKLSDSRHGFGVEGSWPSFVPPPLQIPIDHCLISAEIGIRQRRVGPALGSDHRPILVDFWMLPR